MPAVSQHTLIRFSREMTRALVTKLCPDPVCSTAEVGFSQYAFGTISKSLHNTLAGNL